VNEIHNGDVAYLGISSDSNSSFMRGAAQGPAKVREVLHNGASGLTDERARPAVNDPRFKDLGDHTIGDSAEDYLAIENIYTPLLEQGARPLTVGGDHAITYPILRAFAKHHARVSVRSNHGRGPGEATGASGHPQRQ